MEVDTAVFGLVSWAGRGSQKRHGFNDGGRVWGDEPTPGGRDSWASLAALQDVAWGVTCGGVIGGPGVWSRGTRGVACGRLVFGVWPALGGEGCSLGRGLRGVARAWRVVAWPVDVARGGCGPQGVTYGRGRTLQALPAFRTSQSRKAGPHL